MAKKILSLVLFGTITFIGFSPMIANAESIEFDQTIYNLEINTNFTLTINAVGLNDVSSINFILEYDPEVISFASTSDGIFTDPESMFGISAGADIFDGMEQLSVDVPCDLVSNGDGELVQIHFDTTGNGGVTDITFLEMNYYINSDPFTPFPGTTGAIANVSVEIPDSTNPGISITSPTASSTYNYINASSTLSISGTSTDNVLVSSVTFSSDTGDSGTAVGTSTWSANVDLLQGENLITFVSTDSTGNTASTTLLVNYSLPDITNPQISILTPTTEPAYAHISTSSMITISGTSTDNVLISSVTYSADTGNSGTAVGTNNWTAYVFLTEGVNVIDITAHDSSNNTSTSTITVTFTDLDSLPDETNPQISILTPTTEPAYAYSSTSSLLTITGTSTDNILVSSVTFSANTGDSGTAIGTNNWVANVNLTEGVNIINITVFDSSDNFSSSTLTVTFTELDSDAIAPVRSAGSPSGALVYTTTNTTLSVTTDENATCHYSATAGVSFASSTVFTNTGGLIHTTNIAGLTSGNSYNYYIRCSDSSDNINTNDYTISFSVNSAPSGGGGGGGSSYTTPQDTTAPAQVNNFIVIRNNPYANLSWTNPLDTDFSKVVLLKSEIQLSASTTLLNSKTFANTIYEGNGSNYTDVDINDNSAFYYYIFSVDKSNNSGYFRSAVLTKISTTSPVISPDPATNPVEQTIHSLIGASSATVEVVTKKESNIIRAINSQVKMTLENIRVYERITSGKDIATINRFRIAHFIQFGTPTTIILGAGERGGVIDSYFNAFSKMPSTESEWMDVIKIANGRWPSERNKALEDKTKNEIFKKIYKRGANMDNANDNAAVTIITYGLRPANRNLGSEKISIAHFKGIFGRNPSSAADWNIVRSIAYSGAKR